MIAGAILFAAATAVQSSTPSAAAPAQVSSAVDIAISACENWLLEPKTWADGIDKFPSSTGLAAQGLRSQPSVPDAALPPVQLRRALHHWHVPVSAGGLYVTVSDQLPLCHVVGGGAEDYQPGTLLSLNRQAFAARWTRRDTSTRSGIRTTMYESNVDPKLSMIVSHATTAGERTDRAQLVITAQYRLGN